MTAAAGQVTRRRGARALAWVIGGAFAGLTFVVVIVFAVLSGDSGGCGQVGTVSGRGIPPRLIPIYQTAAQRYRLGPLGPAVLAAVNSIETSFGANLSVSTAGAVGWMQFIPSTWRAYGVDGDGDGRRDPANPADAIHSAANYLHASGAPRDWHGAIFAYNHAEWYVASVLRLAQRYAKTSTLPATPDATAAIAAGGEGACGELGVPGQYVFPIPARARMSWQRIDMGKDMNAPYGTPLLAIGNGTITTTSGGFPCSVVLALTDGPYRGRSIYYGHSGPHVVRSGQRVRAGQVITHAHGNECGGEPGHMELGWAKGTGPAAYYCAAETGGVTCPHETPEGRSFYRFLLAIRR